MRQVRLAAAAVIGVLTLCGLAVVATLVDYVSHPPRLANVRVPPVVMSPVPGTAGQDLAAPPPTAPPATSAPPTAAPPAHAPTGVAAAATTQTQQLKEPPGRQRRHTGRGPG